MEQMFYISLFLSGYSYFIYPLLLRLLPVRYVGRDDSSDESYIASMTLIITVHNEEQRIRGKLENTLQLDYPADSLEVIVASDCSTDETDAIVESYRDRGVRLVRADEHKGKEYAQLCAIREARGDILVFSDVATRIETDALGKIAQVFSDPVIGAVSSEDRFVSRDGRVAGEGAYVRYEMWLRRLESERAGLVGLSGSFFAARREVCADWDNKSCSDFNTALNCAMQKRIAVSSPAVVGIYQDVKDSALEYRRKVRTVLRGITAIARHPQALSPRHVGWLFAFQVWSHKILRWAVPWFMLGTLVSSFYLVQAHWFYAAVFAGQLLFYLLVLGGQVFPGLRDRTLVRIPYFFVQVNLAIAHATLAFLAGRRMSTWTPSQR